MSTPLIPVQHVREGDFKCLRCDEVFHATQRHDCTVTRKEFRALARLTMILAVETRNPALADDLRELGVR